MKPKFPLILVCARDWNLYRGEHDENFDFNIAQGWIAGFLIRENKDSLVISAQHFDEEEIVRSTHVIPKECILFKKIIKT